MPDIAKMRQEYFGGGWDEEHEALKEDNTCCHQSMAIWLMICNGILIILALACFIVGIVITTKPAFTFTAGSLGVGCIFLGLFLLMVGGLGICAACRKSKCGLGIYSVLLTIFLIGELAAMAVAVAAPGVAVNGMNSTWDTLSSDYRDFIGLYYGCCAADPTVEANKDLAGETQDDNGVWSNDGVYCATEVDALGAEQVTKLGGKCQVHGLVWEAEAENKYVFAAYNAVADANGLIWANTCQGTGQTTDSSPWTFGAGEENCFCAPAATAADSNPVDAACRQAKGAIPACTTAGDIKNPFTFAAGVSNAAVAADTIHVGAAACYAKFENWLASNMGGTIAVLVILFLYQIFNVGFACALWCNKCSKKSSDEPAGDEVGGVGI